MFRFFLVFIDQMLLTDEESFLQGWITLAGFETFFIEMGSVAFSKNITVHESNILFVR